MTWQFVLFRTKKGKVVTGINVKEEMIIFSKN